MEDLEQYFQSGFVSVIFFSHVQRVVAMIQEREPTAQDRGAQTMLFGSVLGFLFLLRRQIVITLKNKLLSFEHQRDLDGMRFVQIAAMLKAILDERDQEKRRNLCVGMINLYAKQKGVLSGHAEALEIYQLLQMFRLHSYCHALLTPTIGKVPHEAGETVDGG